MMAKTMQDAEFWLPTEFPFEFDSFGTNSSLSSPGESIAGSTETGESSDEDDFLASLTRRFALSSLSNEVTLNKGWNMACSPQSTLSGGLGSLPASRNGSPTGPSRFPSPPDTPFGVKNDTWDLIYAAAGQVARLKMSQQGRALLDAHRRSAALARNQSQTQNSAFYPNNNVQFQQGRQSQMYKQESCPASVYPQEHFQQIQNRGRAFGYETLRCGNHVTAPILHVQNQKQQHIGGCVDGIAAAFPGGSEVKKKSTGTGVFLPRRYANPVETRKKSGCSTVLIPPKVVQALNLNVDEMKGHAQPRFNHVGGYSQIHVDSMMAKSNELLTQQRRSLRHEGPLNHELRLPQEWTY